MIHSVSLAVLLGSLVGCGMVGSPEGVVDFGELVAEYPGVHVLAPLEWTYDGDGVFWQGYLEGHDFQYSPLHLTDLATGTTQVVALLGTGPFEYMPLEDGQTLIYRAEDDPCFYRYDLPTKQSEPIMCDGNVEAWTASSDGQALAYQGTDETTFQPQVTLYEPGSGASRALSDTMLPVPTYWGPPRLPLFSPDGSHLVVRPADADGTLGRTSLDVVEFGIVDVASGHVYYQAFEAIGYEFPEVLVANWTPDNVRFLICGWVATGVTCRVYDPLSGEYMTVNPADERLWWSEFDWSWSRDGGTLTFPWGVCLKWEPGEHILAPPHCVAWQYGIYAHELGGALSGPLVQFDQQYWPAHTPSPDGGRAAIVPTDDVLNFDEIFRLYVPEITY